MMKLTQREILVLEAWSQIHDLDCSIISFSDVADECGIQRPRRYVRALARKRLVVMCQIFNEDSGRVQGSGYTPTDAGWDLIDSLFAEDEFKCQ